MAGAQLASPPPPAPPYKRLLMLRIWSIFARFGHVTFKPGKFTDWKTLFPAVPMVIRRVDEILGFWKRMWGEDFHVFVRQVSVTSAF